MSSPVGVAIIGAGVISKQYLDNFTSYPDIKVLGIADLDTDRARARADEYDVPVAGDVDLILGLDEVEIVVNLTIPAAHAEVTRATIRAGMHTYTEKPLAIDTMDGKKLLAEARGAAVRIGCAPDTFLSAGMQSARRALDEGAIGTPLTATAAIMNLGPDHWHPDPGFLFARGAGPLFDLGPYYLTGLVSLLGSITRVAALNRQAQAERTIGAGPNAGARFPVEVPTLVTALLDFASGPSATSTFSFDHTHRHSVFELTGTEATLALPNPGGFKGPLKLRKRGDNNWTDIPVQDGTSGRGVGVVDMAQAIRTGRPHRASGDLAQHVLEVMTAIDAAGNTDGFVPIRCTATSPEPLPPNWDPHAPTL